MSTPPELPATLVAPRMSAASRLVNVVVDPKRAFTDIAARPGWWPPMILLVVVSLVFMAAFSNRIGWEHFMRQQMETNKQIQDMPSDQRERVIETQAKFAGVIGTVGVIIGVPISMLITAGIMLFMFTTVLGGSANFKQTLGAVAYSWVPSVISSLIALLMMFLRDPSDFDLNNPTAFNIGYYLDPHSTAKWLVSLGTSIDLFSLWVILLLATGMSIAAKKSWGSALMGVVTPWALYVLVKVGWAAIRG